jgi:hypothetical protein
MPVPEYRIHGLVTDPVQVVLPRWQWIYFAGWMEGVRAGAELESIQINRVAEAIAGAINA